MTKTTEQKNTESTERPPVVVVMGHIDHGKSTLLDFIRKSNIVDKEAGGITQHISAYEVIHKDEHGHDKKITFLDTPGHEAFSKMRTRGATVADIAILVVSAEDGVKAQTLEALQTIIDAKLPYIVAINKIDKAGADIERTKNNLVENGVYLEGYGGAIPSVPISAKKGDGVSELLDTILLAAELEEFTGTHKKQAEGIVIESHMDTKRGMSATLIIKDGTLSKGMFVVVDESMSGTRILEDFLGKPIANATFSSPIRIIGFDSLPKVGSTFISFESKKDAEKAINNFKENKTTHKGNATVQKEDVKYIPIIIKTDVSGTTEAIEKEIEKLNKETVAFSIINKGVGGITEADVKHASGNKETIIVGFNVKQDNAVRELGEKMGIEIQSFDIIYKLTDWLAEVMEVRRPRHETVEVIGKAKILKTFSKTKERQVIGGKVLEGKISSDANVRILRRDFELGRGKIVGLEKSKSKTREVNEEEEFGMLVESKVDVSAGDIIESYIMVEK